MSGERVLHVYSQWFRTRLRSTIFWAIGLVAVVVMTEAFYPSLGDALGDLSEGGGLTSVLGLSEGIDPSTPLGYHWSNLYANNVPWILMALGITLGAAAIAGDEERGTLEYLLSKPVLRPEILIARFVGLITILFVVALTSGIALMILAPAFDLTGETTSMGANGQTITNPGLSIDNAAAGTFAAFSIGVGTGAIAFLIGAATGRYGLTVGVTAGYSIAAYLLYTLSNTTGDLEFLTWISPWRWYVEEAMFINGLASDVALPFALSVVCLAAAWALFVRRDLKS
jgi:ABC-2 type transport system permease protein